MPSGLWENCCMFDFSWEERDMLFSPGNFAFQLTSLTLTLIFLCKFSNPSWILNAHEKDVESPKEFWNDVEPEEVI